MGHALNNKLLRALMADRAAWRHAPAAPTCEAALEQAAAA
jgi:UDP-3-O-acyl-N-acetylglucosamine deacetylase